MRESDPRRVLEILARHVSSINGRVMSERARRVLRDPGTIAADEWSLYVSTLRSSARLFLPEPALGALLDDLQRSAGPHRDEAAPVAREIAILNEQDLQVARLAARELCQRMGAPGFVVQRIATSVSELARNIVSYTGGGRLTLEPLPGPPPRLRIVASDDGPGIPHLSEVLGGSYRSKTGLGRGLLGVKRLMELFDVRTSPAGTHITVEAALK